MPLEILEVHFDCAGSQNLVGRSSGCLSRLRSRSGAVRIFGHGPVVTFRGWRKGNLVILTGARGRSGVTSKRRIRRSTLDMVVTFDAL